MNIVGGQDVYICHTFYKSYQKSCFKILFIFNQKSSLKLVKLVKLVKTCETCKNL
jgi:hypothetical protein